MLCLRGDLRGFTHSLESCRLLWKANGILVSDMTREKRFFSLDRIRIRDRMDKAHWCRVEGNTRRIRRFPNSPTWMNPKGVRTS
jgi:hypothetical protein